MRDGRIKALVKIAIPKVIRQWVRLQLQRWSCRPLVGMVQFGSLRRIQPISRIFGFDRGLCIDRYYIEHFLTTHMEDIKGHILEIGDDVYTRKFGGNRVVRSDVLYVLEGNPRATIVADLTCADNIPSDTFDCIIFTQTLQHIYNIHKALQHLWRILKPGGVLLATFPGISQISRYDMDRWGDYWRFTTLSANKLFKEVFPPENVNVKAFGNVLTAIAFLHGLAGEELNQRELNYCDPDYELLITVRAKKSDLKL